MWPTFSGQSGICTWCRSWCASRTVPPERATIHTEGICWNRSPELRRRPETLGCAASRGCSALLCRKPNGTPHLKGKYEHWRPQGAWQNEEQFSDGTLRLLGLLWATLEGSGPLLLEEPELSLHPEVVTHLPHMFARMQSRTGRQVILSRHSPSILADPGIGLDEAFLLVPEREGTIVRPVKRFQQIVSLLEGGLSLPDAVMPFTRPARAEQLPLFAIR